MRTVWIVSGARTPIGSFQGALSSLTAPELGAVAIREAVVRSTIDTKEISEVHMGCVLTAAVGQAPARQAALKAGLPNSIPCTTVGKVCGSGLKAVMLGCQAIACGEAEVVVAGGMESMSNAPYALPGVRQGLRLGPGKLIDTMVHDGLWDVTNDFHMGSAAEICARECKIPRDRQDAYAKESYTRALRAIREGMFKDEIVPVQIPNKKGMTIVSEDEEPGKVIFEKIPELKPVFEKDGTITAANASTLNDGAAALVLVSEEFGKKRNLKAMAKVAGQAQAAREPEWFTIAPVDAIQNLFKKLNWGVENVDLFEVNEAFSVVSLAVNDKLKLDEKKVNVHGGAVALGHPIGASGARLLVTLLYALKRHAKKRGIVSLCIGGGEAVALGVEVL